VSTARRDPEDALRAILLTLAPAAFSPVTTPELLAQRGVSPWVVPGVVAALLAGTGLGSGMPARLLGTAGLLLGASSWVTCHLEAPGLGALVLMGAVALLSALWPAADGSFLRGLRPAPAAALTAAALVLHGWTASLLGPLGPYGVVGAVAVAAGVGLRGADGGRQLAWVAGLVPVAWGLLHAGGVVGTQTLALLALAPAATLARTVPPERVWRPVARVIAEVLLSSPPRLLVSTFAVASLVGTFALSLPVADVRGRGLSLVDAAFDAVSAVTLTGLVATPRTNLTAFGQLVTFGLFQVGALAVMTLAAASAEASRRAGPRAELSSGHLLGHDVRHGLLAALRRVGTLTAAVEGAGALLLLPALLASGHGLRALWEAPFLAASAFCGAGHTPWAASLQPFARDPWVTLVVAGIAVAGTLGPMVLLALPAVARGEAAPVWLRLSLLGNVVLWVVPFGLIVGLEWTRALASLPAHDRLASAALLAASARTAGFSGVDLAAAEPATRTLLSLLMFVGGNTGSAAGGVKVSTMAVLLLAALAAIRGRRAVEFGSRQLPSRVVFESVAIVAGGIAVVVLGTVLMQLTQPLRLERILFEVVSAVSTSGLSSGLVGELDGVGKIVLLGCMFAGRVGPLTLFLLLASEQEREGGATWPSEEVPVG
jgi:trk system potassium uptake protein TrkH